MAGAPGRSRCPRSIGDCSRYGRKSRASGPAWCRFRPAGSGD
jgi:hypothetical protein